MNRALIDTDIISYYFKGDINVIKNFENYLEIYDIIEISIISYYEVLSGLKAKKAIKQLSVFENFISENAVLPVTEKSVNLSADIYSQLKQTGNLIDDIDLLIAGIAIANNMTLITNNISHFGRIVGLNVENWKYFIE